MMKPLMSYGLRSFINLKKRVFILINSEDIPTRVRQFYRWKHKERRWSLSAKWRTSSGRHRTLKSKRWAEFFMIMSVPRVPQVHHQVVIFVNPTILSPCRAKIHLEAARYSGRNGLHWIFFHLLSTLRRNNFLTLRLSSLNIQLRLYIFFKWVMRW